jgi:hypothetical protein
MPHLHVLLRLPTAIQDFTSHEIIVDDQMLNNDHPATILLLVEQASKQLSKDSRRLPAQCTMYCGHLNAISQPAPAHHL